MFDVMADWMNMPLMAYRYGEGVPKRTALSHSFIAPYGAFETSDEKKILISIQNDREWVSFCCNVLDNKMLATEKRLKNNVERYKNKAYLEKKISAVFRKETKKNVCNKLERAHIAYASLNSIKDLSDHELLRNREISFGETLLSIADFPITSGTKGTSIVPLLDQHGKLLRTEFKVD